MKDSTEKKQSLFYSDLQSFCQNDLEFALNSNEKQGNQQHVQLAKSRKVLGLYAGSLHVLHILAD